MHDPAGKPNAAACTGPSCGGRIMKEQDCHRPEQQERMSDTDLTVIRTYINNFEAQLAKSALEAAGIESAIRSDDCGGMRPHMQMAGVELVVRTENAIEANAILEADQDAPDSNA